MLVLNDMIIVALIVLGLMLGSLANATVWRFYKQLSYKKKDNKYSILQGRSMCPSCGHQLAATDLVPVFSWLSLKGKCRYCKAPISMQYPLVEIITSGLFVFSYIYWPYQLNKEGIFLLLVWLLFIFGFICLSIYDLRWKILPNKMVFPLIYLALGQIFVRLVFFNGSFKLLIGSMWGVIFSAGLFYAIFIISNGRWIGGGDVKLSIVLGLILGGPLEAVLMIFISAIIGTIFSIILLSSKKMNRKSLIPYGPFLMAATYICYLFGPQIIHWYKNLVF